VAEGSQAFGDEARCLGIVFGEQNMHAGSLIRSCGQSACEIPIFVTAHAACAGFSFAKYK
jgi:hypothetical protein